MKMKLTSILLTLCMVLTLLSATAQAASTTKTINAGTFTLQISKVYAMGSKDKSACDGYFTTYCIVVPASATIKCTKETNTGIPNSYLIWPFNDITFSSGPMYPTLEKACDYDDAIYVAFKKGDTISLASNNEYSFSGGKNGRYYNVRIFVVDDEKLVQFGGAKPAKKPAPAKGSVSAVPSKTNFFLEKTNKDTVEEWPKIITQAYNINKNDYLQLREIAVLLNRTSAQFDLGMEGQTVVIKPGKPFSGTLVGHKIQKTTDVRPSMTKFKINDEVFSFAEAKTIGGTADYIQLIDFAKKLSGTASQYNVYYDSAAGKAVIQPGAPYVGTKYEAPVTELQQIKTDGDVLPDGDYFMQIFGKYVYPVKGGRYWLELKDKRPEKPFNVKLVSNSDEKGPKYSIAYNGTYIMLPGSAQGAQLQSTTSKTPHYWRIDMNSDFCTIRDYKKQEQIVNASGESSDNGTKIIGWSSTGSTPDNAKIVFFTEAVSNN